MLKCLFRANANNNGVYLSALYDVDAKPIVIRKSSATLSSITRLKKEVQGTKWYSQISKEELIFNIDFILKKYFYSDLFSTSIIVESAAFPIQYPICPNHQSRRIQNSLNMDANGNMEQTVSIRNAVRHSAHGKVEGRQQQQQCKSRGRTP